MAAETEEWALKLLDMASGNALKIAGSLGNLDSTQLKAAQSAMGLANAQARLAAAEESGNIAGRAAAQDALKRLQLSDAMRAARAQESAAKAAATAQQRAESAAAKDADRTAREAAKASAKLNQDAGKRAAEEQRANLSRMKRDQDAAAKHSKLVEAEKTKQAKAAADLGRANDAAGSMAGASWSSALASLSSLGPQGMVAAAAIAVITAGVAALTVAIYKMGEAALSVIAQRNQLLATFGALSGGGTGGAKTLAIVEKLGTALPFATAQIAEWATGLQKAGLQGRALEGAIKAVAAAEALIKGGGEAARSLITTLAMGGPAALSLIATLKRGGPEARAQLADMGLRVQDLAAALGMSVAQFQRAHLSAKQMAEAVEKALARKAAGPLADLMLTFPVLIQRVREGFLSLFDKLGPAVRPFMKAVKSLFDQFSKGGGAIAFLKPIVTSVMSTLFRWATVVVTAISSFVSWMTKAGKSGGVLAGVASVVGKVWGVLVTIFTMVRNAFHPLIMMFQKIMANGTAMAGITMVFKMIAAVVGIVVIAVAAFVGIFIAAGAIVGSVIAAIAGGLSWLAGAIVEGLSALDPSAFVEKMKAMAMAGLNAFKAALGIASPSKVMLEHGEKNIAGAAATGVDKGADKMDASMDRLGAPPKGGKGSGKGGPLAEFNNCTFNGGCEQTVRDTVGQMLREWASEHPEPEPA